MYSLCKAAPSDRTRRAATIASGPIEELVEVGVFLDSHDGTCKSQILNSNRVKFIRGFPLTTSKFEIVPLV
jgi:hypothetical protein